MGLELLIGSGIASLGYIALQGKMCFDYIRGKDTFFSKAFIPIHNIGMKIVNYQEDIIKNETKFQEVLMSNQKLYAYLFKNQPYSLIH